MSAIPVVNGRWSAQVSSALANGAYALSLWDYATNANINNTTIAVQAPPSPAYSGTGTYKEYRDGVLGLQMDAVDEPWAYNNCKINATKNFPGKVVRCTWNEIEIYNSATGVGASATTPNANLANALTALESALKALIAKLTQ